MNKSQLLAASLLHSQLEKKAEGFWSGVGDIALGTGGAAGVLDPAQRGLVQDFALYSNPFSGVPTALNDSARNFSQGNYLSGVGNLAMGALSFAPGLGAAVGKGIGWLGKGLRGVGRFASLAPKGRGVGKVLRMGGNQLIQGGRSYAKAAPRWEAPMARVNQRLASGIQQKIPQKFDRFSWRNPVRSGFDAAASKPMTSGLTAVTTLGGGGSAPSAPAPQQVLQATTATQPKAPPPWAPPQRPYSP